MKKEIGLNDLNIFVEDFLKNLNSKENESTIVLLKGNLGAGKTTFTKEISKQLGIEKEITSPTFTLMQKYEISSNFFEKLIHIDLYRIEDESEIKILDLENLLKEPKTLILIEWPERAENILNKIENKNIVNIEYNDNQSRIFEIIYGKK